MRWSDEKYVRVYTRDTIDWLGLSFEAQGLLALILRKVDRAGLAKLGRHGKRGVAVLVGHPTRWETIAPALEELLSDGCVRIDGDVLVVPNFIEAQEAIQTDAQRKRSQRERDRDIAAARVAYPIDWSRNVTGDGESVTKRDRESRNVTNCPAEAERGHAESRAVTSGHSDPIRSEPSDPDLTPPPAASVSCSQLTLLASGSGEEQPACQKEPTDAEKIRAVFAHYRTYHPRAFPSAASTSKEWRLIQARLREDYTVADLCEAIDGYHRSAWHLGENQSGKKYLGLELIVRDGTHVAAGIMSADEPPKPVMSEREMRSQRAVSGFLDRLETLGLGGTENGQG